jgi:hypothetical protein
MTKARIVIFTASFLAFLLIGFAIAYVFRLRIPSPVAQPNSATPLPVNSQQNLLVIHVDELGKPNPKLISVWVVFFVQYDSTFVSFKSLYPDPLAPRPILPVNVFFSMNAEGRPSDAFFKWVEEHRLEWTAYILIDQEGMEQISEGTNFPGLDFIIPHSKDQLQAVWQQEARLMDHLCTQFLPGEKKPDIDWDELIPNHFRSDLSFENAILIWDQLQAANTPPNCAVFGLN